MNNIPQKLRREMNDDLFYGRCCLTGGGKVKNLASQWDPKRIEWHHNLIYAGKQVQEKWCILPVIKELHDRANDPEVRKIMDWVMLNRATETELARYSKVDNLVEKRDKLNEEMGIWKPWQYPLRENYGR